MRIQGKIPPTDAVSVLRAMPPGMALYTREQIDRGAWEVAWLVREETGRIEGLGPHPEIEFRAGAIEQDGILLLPILLRVGPFTADSVYETWMNAHQPERAGQLAIGDLAIQPRLVVHLYGDDCRLVRSLRVGNHLQVWARKALSRVTTDPPWTMSAFDEAREQIYARYTRVVDLWNGMGETS